MAAASGTWTGPFGFAGNWGYQEDGDSGLQLLRHRYYGPSTGRFLTGDPIKDGRNWYTYCENNPLTCVDPEGYFSIDWRKVGIAVGVIAVTAVVTPIGAPIGIAIGIGIVLGAIGGAANGLIDYTDSHPDNFTWKGLQAKVAEDAVIGAIAGGVGGAAPGISGGLRGLGGKSGVVRPLTRAELLAMGGTIRDQ
ncbi:MAG: RHS repeat-associated core domain-containing protein [Fimbriimonadaceae bacterium]|nr:RHS repeat-associated core domain-containing protein [Fimbriimonadaceae bacterium]